jgi:hypothetical protein
MFELIAEHRRRPHQGNEWIVADCNRNGQVLAACWTAAVAALA